MATWYSKFNVSGEKMLQLQILTVFIFLVIDTDYKLEKTTIVNDNIIMFYNNMVLSVSVYLLIHLASLYRAAHEINQSDFHHCHSRGNNGPISVASTPPTTIRNLFFS